MPATRDDDSARRSVVPPVAGRTLWLAAVWTGVGTAVVCAIVAVVVVAICWLPSSSASSHTSSAIKAGLLTFLAALHGGITVDGTAAHFVPLGLTIIVGLVAWRAGSGLADAAEGLDERDPVRLVLAGATQIGGFLVTCLIIVPVAALGTSDAPIVGVGLAAIVLFALTGSVAFVASSPLRGWAGDRAPRLVAEAVRPAFAAVVVYLGFGAVLVAASLVVHHGQVEALSRQLGGGWGSLAILLLGILAAPNAAIAGASYLAGPGFAVGAGSTTSAFTTTHGVLPAFPLLGAMPQGHGATTPVWWLMGVTAVLAASASTRIAVRAATWPARLRVTVSAAVGAGVIMAALAGLGGGAVGDGRLRTVGASSWRLGLAVSAVTAVVGLVVLVGHAVWRWIDAENAPALATLLAARDREDAGSDGVDAHEEPAAADRVKPTLAVVAEKQPDSDEGNQLAG